MKVFCFYFFSDLEYIDYVLELNDKFEDIDRNVVGDNDFLKGIKVIWENFIFIFYYNIYFSRKFYSEYCCMFFILFLM